MTRRRAIPWREWRWIILAGLLVVAVSSIPYLVAWSFATPDRVFSGCILLFEDCASYLAKMRQGAEGAWLFHISYTPETHPGALFFPFHLILGKTARFLPGGNLGAKLILACHLARVVFGLAFLLMAYRFLAAFTRRLAVRRLAWLMVAWGGGLGWLLAGLGKTRWLDSPPLDLFLAEGFGFIAVYGFPHIAAAQSLLLGGFLCLLGAWGGNLATKERGSPKAVHSPQERTETNAQQLDVPRIAIGAPRARSLRWAGLAGLVWLLMGLIIPFYVAVAWAVAGAGWIVLAVREGLGATRSRPLGFPRGRLTRERPSGPTQGTGEPGSTEGPKGLVVSERLPPITRRLPCKKAALAGIAMLISAPVVIYSGWRFTSHPVYAAWAAQNRILSPHPLHYLAAYGMPLALGGLAAKDVWNDRGNAWLALAWVAVVPILVYLPVNIQMRLLTGVQIPLSFLAACGAVALWNTGRRWLPVTALASMTLTSLFILVSSSVWMVRQPFPSFRDRAELVALDWLAAHTQPGDVVLTAYDTGAYLPARVHARVLAGHDLEAMDATEKKAMIDRFFDRAADDPWRERFLDQYGIDYVFWGPAERDLGRFDPHTAQYLRQAYQSEDYIVFRVER